MQETNFLALAGRTGLALSVHLCFRSKAGTAGIPPRGSDSSPLATCCNQFGDWFRGHVKLTALAACFLKVSLKCKYYLISHADICWFIFTHSVYSQSLNLLTDTSACSWDCIWWGRKLCIRRGQGHTMESHLWESAELLGSEVLVPRPSTAATVFSFCNPRS